MHFLSKIAVLAMIGYPLITANSLARVNSEQPPLKIVIGFSPGGALDIYTRILSDKIRVSTGRTVIIENKPGAATRLAVDYVKRAPADGNTVLISPAPPVTVFPLTYKKLSYDPDKNLVPVAFLADVPLVVSSGSVQPYKTMPEYLSWARKNPQAAGFGLVGLGGVSHFGILRLNEKTGLNLVPAAYKGAAPMLADEVGGVLPIGIDAVASKMELYKSGRINFLGVTGETRSITLPNVPTLKESGVSGFETVKAWYAVFAPEGTSDANVKKLETMFIAAANNQEVIDKMKSIGMESSGKSSEYLKNIIQVQRESWRPVIEKSGFVADE